MTTSSNIPACRLLIGAVWELLAGIGTAELRPFLAQWPSGEQTRPVAPTALPVLRWLAHAKAGAPAFAVPVVEALCRTASEMAWRRSYEASSVGEHFYRNYGWSELIGLDGYLASARLACGFLLLGPETHYPLHRHEAEEIYLPITGDSIWLKGNAGWRERRPGEVIYHGHYEPHAMCTLAQPLLALYLWRSDDLHQRSELDRESPGGGGERAAAPRITRAKPA